MILLMIAWLMKSHPGNKHSLSKLKIQTHKQVSSARMFKLTVYYVVLNVCVGPQRISTYIIMHYYMDAIYHMYTVRISTFHKPNF